MAGKIAPETPRAGVVFVDGRLGALWATQVGRVSSRVVNPVSTRRVSLGPNEPCVAHLVAVVSVAVVGARILFRSILLRLAAVVPQTATSPVLTLLLLLPICPALAMLLLLLLLLLSGCPALTMLLLQLLLLLLPPGCPVLIMLLLLLQLGSPVSNTTSR